MAESSFEMGRRGHEVTRSSVYRTLVRNGLVEPKSRRRRRKDCRRWERGTAMELWQLDVTASAFLTDGTEVKIVTGIDDHSRFCVLATAVMWATARRGRSLPPQPGEPITVQRRVSSRGGLMVARQKIHAGMLHAGKTATVTCANTNFRVVIDGETAAVVPRTTTSAVHRCKANATHRGELLP